MKRLLIRLIRIYQNYLSPMNSTKFPYYPTCSAYSADALEFHGAFTVSILAAWLLRRCNPFSHVGVDPVPRGKKINIKSLYNRK